MDHFDIECELKFAADAKDGAIEGYGSVFGILDRGGDIVLPGAFKASLAELRRKKSKVPMLWQHDPSKPIGVWTELAEDEKGLKVKGEMILDVPQAAEVRALLLGGAVKGLSIGYRTQDHELDRSTGARRLKKLDLWEISLVTFPMLPEAQVMNVKSFDPQALEKALRDEAQLSIREAKAAVSVFRKTVLRDAGQSEPAPEMGRDVLMSLRKMAESLR